MAMTEVKVVQHLISAGPEGVRYPGDELSLPVNEALDLVDANAGAFVEDFDDDGISKLRELSKRELELEKQKAPEVKKIAKAKGSKDKLDEKGGRKS